jgi:tetratricopeptide (TPR) repeat protein
MAKKPKRASAAQRFVVEERQRLSRSRLWKWQRRFFEEKGVGAWSDATVPHYITNNPFIANAYAKLVFGYLRDLAAEGPLRGPLPIIELGAGSGRFAFLFLKHFANLSALAGLPFKYVMTDFAESTLDHWRSHPSLRPFVQAGQLDFARFDAERDEEIRLDSGGVLPPGPMAFLANYFFDSLPQDGFFFDQGRAAEVLVSLFSSREERDLDDAGLIGRVQPMFSRQPISGAYYDDAELDALLDDYRARLQNATVLFPAAGIRCIRRLRRLCGDRLLLVSADKGYSTEEALLRQGVPEINVHGSFSLMVNYHALGQYVTAHGGRVLANPHRDTGLHVGTFLFGQSRDVETRLAHADAVVLRGPDDFFHLKKSVEKNYDGLSLEQLLAYLRFSGWDSNIALGCSDALMARLAPAEPAARVEVREALRQIWEHYYPMNEPRDLAFQLGSLSCEIESYRDGLEYFHHSLARERAPRTFLHLGICHYCLGEPDAARGYFEKVLELEPQSEAALALLHKISVESL